MISGLWRFTASRGRLLWFGCFLLFSPFSFFFRFLEFLTNYITSGNKDRMIQTTETGKVEKYAYKSTAGVNSIVLSLDAAAG